jgi:3-hydroxybutyryl-CoA dehydrogenase
VVTTDYTNENTRTTILELVAKLGKTAVLCKDAPGFIVNHVARPYYLEALRLVEEGVADFETIDRLMENAGFKMGPFKLMDLIGNDINYAVSSSVYESMNKPARLKPSPIQEQKVKNNELGKKTGRGYYPYP